MASSTSCTWWWLALTVATIGSFCGLEAHAFIWPAAFPDGSQRNLPDAAGCSSYDAIPVAAALSAGSGTVYVICQPRQMATADTVVAIVGSKATPLFVRSDCAFPKHVAVAPLSPTQDALVVGCADSGVVFSVVTIQSDLSRTEAIVLVPGLRNGGGVSSEACRLQIDGPRNRLLAACFGIVSVVDFFEADWSRWQVAVNSNLGNACAQPAAIAASLTSANFLYIVCATVGVVRVDISDPERPIVTSFFESAALQSASIAMCPLTACAADTIILGLFAPVPEYAQAAVLAMREGADPVVLQLLDRAKCSEPTDVALASTGSTLHVACKQDGIWHTVLSAQSFDGHAPVWNPTISPSSCTWPCSISASTSGDVVATCTSGPPWRLALQQASASLQTITDDHVQWDQCTILHGSASNLVTYVNCGGGIWGIDSMRSTLVLPRSECVGTSIRRGLRQGLSATQPFLLCAGNAGIVKLDGVTASTVLPVSSSCPRAIDFLADPSSGALFALCAVDNFPRVLKMDADGSNVQPLVDFSVASCDAPATELSWSIGIQNGGELIVLACNGGGIWAARLAESYTAFQLADSSFCADPAGPILGQSTFAVSCLRGIARFGDANAYVAVANDKFIGCSSQLQLISSSPDSTVIYYYCAGQSGIRLFIESGSISQQPTALASVFALHCTVENAVAVAGQQFSAAYVLCAEPNGGVSVSYVDLNQQLVHSLMSFDSPCTRGESVLSVTVSQRLTYQCLDDHQGIMADTCTRVAGAGWHLSAGLCTPCPAGSSRFASVEGIRLETDLVCHKCGNGYYASTESHTVCESCPPGRSTPDDRGDFITCTECPAGTATSLVPAGCTNCPPGTVHTQQWERSQTSTCSSFAFCWCVFMDCIGFIELMCVQGTFPSAEATQNAKSAHWSSAPLPRDPLTANPVLAGDFMCKETVVGPTEAPACTPALSMVGGMLHLQRPYRSAANQRSKLLLFPTAYSTWCALVNFTWFEEASLNRSNLTDAEALGL